MNSKTKVLLTGASGTVGYEILKQLYQQKDIFEITVFDLDNRKTRKMFSKFNNEINFKYGDIANNEDIASVCADKDFVIHIAAIIPPLADDEPELAHRVNTIGTMNLVRNLEKLSPNAFFLYSSSISVYGDRLINPDIYIDDPILPSLGDEYAKTKIAAEEIITNSKLEWSIFRLTAIMGGHKISKLMFHMPLATSMEICSPADTGRAFVNALSNKDKISGKLFNLGGGASCRCTYYEFLHRSFKIFGLGKVNFPDNSFAEHNFHCGFYQDGDDLEKLLEFRQDTLESYLKNEESKVSGLQRTVTSLFKEIIKNRLIKQSEPLEALRKSDQELINRFFVKIK
ncbi:MAG: NAD(P)-dependent oxidoreductase [Bacteroidales bacterium]|nr:NAD(P)-dependent oxidoreductase [Bacteroidales bacterium]